MRIINLKSSCLAVLVLGVGLVSPSATFGQANDPLALLNKPAEQVRESAKSVRTVLDAYLKVPPPPIEVNDKFNLSTIWPGMDGFSDVSKWAEGCGELGKALVASQKALAFGLPYGKQGLPTGYADRGLFADIGQGADLGVVSLPYLYAVRTIAAYSVAEMYRLGEAGRFDEALEISIATVRVLRQVADRQLAEEQMVAMELMIECLRADRDFMFTYLDKIPATTFQRFALKEFAMIAPMDHEGLRRLQLPEGDRIIAEAVLAQLFAENGSADLSNFSTYFSQRQSSGAPLGMFGARKMWQQVAQVHGSLDSTQKRLKYIYDDWWRRWRMNPYGPIFGLATELSRTNEVRYAAVVFSLKDLQRLFTVRDVLVSEINGTAIIAGICGHYREYGNKWPREKAETYAVYVVKRMDFDPYHKSYPANRNEGRIPFRRLSSAQEIETPFGRVHANGVMLWVRGADHEDGGGTSASLDGLTGDLVIWPPLRALARNEGLIE